MTKSVQIQKAPLVRQAAPCNPNADSWQDAWMNSCYQYGKYEYCTSKGKIGDGFDLAFGFFHNKIEELAKDGFSGLNCPQCGCDSSITSTPRATTTTTISITSTTTTTTTTTSTTTRTTTTTASSLPTTTTIVTSTVTTVTGSIPQTVPTASPPDYSGDDDSSSSSSGTPSTTVNTSGPVGTSAVTGGTSVPVTGGSYTLVFTSVKK